MSLHFVTAPKELATDRLAQLILDELDTGQRVTWLVAGGSNIPVAVSVMQRLLGHEDKLTITLTDERFGPLGHPDSNLQQLVDAGFTPGRAQVVPVLTPGLDLEATAAHFAKNLQDVFAHSDSRIALLGMGADGHTAGILPASPASSENNALTVGYKSQPFQRITTTFSALQQLDHAFCLAYGPEKLAQLQTLARDELPLDRQPAQILKQIPDAYVYNDQLESEDPK